MGSLLLRMHSLVAESGGCSLVVVLSLLIAGASFVAEHKLQSTRVSVVVVHGLSCSVACRIFPDQG